MSRWAFWTTLSSAVVVLVSFYGYHNFKTSTENVRTSINCSTQDEEAVCLMTNVCFKPMLQSGDRSGEQHHHVAGFSVEPLTSPLTYLISVKSFHQSAVYLQTLHDSDEQALPPWDKTKTFIFTRFKPDNLAHVIHDDVLPVYASLAKVLGHTALPFNVRLGFVDEYGIMPYDSMYQKLTSYPLSYNISSIDYSCFDELIAGFDRSTIWYQYGFSVPQGPVHHDSSVILKYIRAFIDQDQDTKSVVCTHIVLLTRTETRLILNEAQLSMSLAKRFSKSVKSVSLELYNFDEIVNIMSSACLVVGMHGALMSSVIWMPTESSVLELFPYAVNPDNYTPYKTLSSILGLKYMSWQNKNPAQTVGHTDWPADFGGLDHLSKSEKEAIIGQEEVPKHLCCEDPSWLYHIYQDTYVDINEIIHILNQSEAETHV